MAQVIDMSTIRIAFAGLAHSHPFSDAQNFTELQRRGDRVELVGVYDSDTSRESTFSERFQCPAFATLNDLCETQPDLVIATPRPNETGSFARTIIHETSAQLFFNKVVAATEAQLADWVDAIGSAAGRVGTASVLQFAPDIVSLSEHVNASTVRGVRVLAQHDIGMFLEPDRKWQDTPAEGGGTLVTVGYHAWAMVNGVFPDASAVEITGRRFRSPDSQTSSEEYADLSCVLELRTGERIPCTVVISGSPGPEVYGIDVFTDSEVHQVHLTTSRQNQSLGYMELAEALLHNTRQSLPTAPWNSARSTVNNTIRAAAALRGTHLTEKRLHHV